MHIFEIYVVPSRTVCYLRMINLHRRHTGGILERLINKKKDSFVLSTRKNQTNFFDLHFQIVILNMAEVINNIVQTVPLEIAGRAWTKISIVRAKEPSFQMGAEDTVIVGMILSIKHHNAKKNQSNNSGVAGYPNKKSKFGLSDNKTYDRLITFADLVAGDGSTFVVIFKTGAEFDEWTSFDRAAGVGHAVLLPEICHIPRNQVFVGMPLVKTTCRMLPLVPRTGDIPRVHLMNYSNSDEQTVWFGRHHAIIPGMTQASIAINDASCGGQQCDRQNRRNDNGNANACGCSFTHRGNPCVMDCVLQLFVPSEFVPEENRVEQPAVNDESTMGRPGGLVSSKFVFNFRSLNTSKHIVHRVDQLDLVHLNHTRGLRIAICAVIAFVNANGGWTCVGWYKKGKVADQSESGDGREATRITNLVQKLHITLLRPTNLALVNTQAYKDLMYDQTIPFPLVPQPANGDAAAANDVVVPEVVVAAVAVNGDVAAVDGGLAGANAAAEEGIHGSDDEANFDDDFHE